MTFLPLPPHHRTDEIQPIAAFIARKILTLKRSLSTAQDADEKVELAAQMTMCEISIALLVMAFLTEDSSLIETAKDIFRGI